MVTYGNINDLDLKLQLGERFLQDDINEGNTTITPSIAPISSPTASSSPVDEDSFPLSAPTSPMDYSPVYSPPTGILPQEKENSSSSSSSSTTTLISPFYGIILACVIGVVGILIFWKFWKAWKSRRERHLLRLQSTRVDAVLGDMQMVTPPDEYDDDDPGMICVYIVRSSCVLLPIMRFILFLKDTIKHLILF